MKTQISYEDKDILVVYKPAGLATQTAKIGQPDVVSELKKYLSGSDLSQKGMPPYLGVIHRLDQPVEGLLVFGKNKAAAANLTAQLQKQGEGGLNKHYIAILCGKPPAQEGELVDYMYKDKENRAVIVDYMYKDKENRAVVVDMGSRHNTNAGETFGNPKSGEPKKAVLKYRVIEEKEFASHPSSGTESAALQVSNLTRVDIEILTGRFHQIRAQMSHAGLPLLGDAKYGSEEAKALAKQLGVQNVALCAYRLELQHPTAGKKMQFVTEPQGRAFLL